MYLFDLYLYCHSHLSPLSFSLFSPSFLFLFHQDDSARDRALFGLCQILKLRSRELLPVVLPPLLKRPMPLAHIQAIGTIAASCGRDVHHVAHKLIPPMVREGVT
jgi:hypothetical protein